MKDTGQFIVIPSKESAFDRSFHGKTNKNAFSIKKMEKTSCFSLQKKVQYRVIENQKKG